jgi:hypothetical protein
MGKLSNSSSAAFSLQFRGRVWNFRAGETGPSSLHYSITSSALAFTNPKP